MIYPGIEMVSISSTFYEQLLRRRYSFVKFFKSQTVIREKLHTALWYKKGTHKMLMKLTKGV